MPVFTSVDSFIGTKIKQLEELEKYFWNSF